MIPGKPGARRRAYSSAVVRRLFVFFLVFALASASWASRPERCCADREAPGAAWSEAPAVAGEVARAPGCGEHDAGAADRVGDARCDCDGSGVCANCDAPPLNALLRWAVAAGTGPDAPRTASVGWHVTAGVRSELLRPPRACAH